VIERFSFVEQVYLKNTPKQQRGEVSFDPSNAQVEGVADRVEVKEGDARHLPFTDNVFDVVVSNFVLHKMDRQNDRNQLVHDMVRLLKPGVSFSCLHRRVVRRVLL